MPWKAYQPLERLDADDVQANLMNQAVLGFTSSAQRDATLGGSAAAGMVSRTEDQDYLEVRRGSQWKPLGGSLIAFGEASSGITPGNQGQWLTMNWTGGTRWADGRYATWPSGDGPLLALGGRYLIGQYVETNDGQLTTRLLRGATRLQVGLASAKGWDNQPNNLLGGGSTVSIFDTTTGSQQLSTERRIDDATSTADTVVQLWVIFLDNNQGA